MDDSLHSYLLTTIKEKSEHIVYLEKYAKENHIPIMEPLSMELLLQIIRLAKPKNILEIGAAIGYSAIRMAEAFPQCKIVTIERDEVRYQEAMKNIQAVNLQNRIEVIFGDALEKEEQIKEKGPFDLLFIDAAKGQYQKFFEIYSPLVHKGGTIVSDNVLFKGYVSGETEADNKRLQKLANKIKKYNDWLVHCPDFHTMIVPVGDGIAISVKS
jgi:predicted O-methyltransferase YrrM